MNEMTWLALLFLAVVLLTFAALRRLARARQQQAERWKEVEDALEPTAPPKFMGPMADALAAQIPMSRTGMDDLQKSLRNAGYYRATALVSYRALRTVLILLPILTGAALALLVPAARVPAVLLTAASAAVLGYSVPRVYVALRARKRSREIELGLPFAIDLLTLALSAGQTILGALQQVASELRSAHPALAEELEIVRQQSAISSLEHTLAQLAERVAVPEMRNLALLLIQSERLGADASSALLEFSNHQRVNLRQNAEATANRASFWMLFPSVCCLWVAASIVLIGPIYFEFWNQRKISAEMIGKSMIDINRANTDRESREKNVAAPRAPAAPNFNANLP
ncbi:MAG TPA: type II secretion system F family protein [Gemmataceae bacterium]|jgi:tight adherence protein C|nr:type II secretion system F family protein [Gemmataceae bacterium]